MTEKLIIFLILLFSLSLVADEKKIDYDKVKNNAEKAFVVLDGKCDDACMKQVDLIEEKAKNIKSIRSSFKQVKKLSFMNSEVVSSGVFLFRKNEKKNQVRWEYTSPFSYIIVIDGDNIVMKDNKKVSRFDMSSSKIFEEINEILIKSLNGTILTDRKNFTFKYADNGDEFHVSMIPGKENLKKYLKEIRMVISKKDYAVSLLKMIESSGDSTTLFFTNKKINGNVSGKEFEVK
jgi:outer membrane lipoprotein-sorting protein